MGGDVNQTERYQSPICPLVFCGCFSHTEMALVEETAFVLGSLITIMLATTCTVSQEDGHGKWDSINVSELTEGWLGSGPVTEGYPFWSDFGGSFPTRHLPCRVDSLAVALHCVGLYC